LWQTLAPSSNLAIGYTQEERSKSNLGARTRGCNNRISKMALTKLLTLTLLAFAATPTLAIFKRKLQFAQDTFEDAIDFFTLPTT
jgi:hypothetical protein